jgi:hypothetical protein
MGIFRETVLGWGRTANSSATREATLSLSWPSKSWPVSIWMIFAFSNLEKSVLPITSSWSAWITMVTGSGIEWNQLKREVLAFAKLFSNGQAGQV